MSIPLTTHLTWGNLEAVAAKNAVRELLDHPGYKYLMEALTQRREQLVTGLLSESPTDEGARYAEKIGELNALRSFEGIVEGILEYGSVAESELDAPDLQPVA